VALWDCLGHWLEVPAYRLLGGQFRSRNAIFSNGCIIIRLPAHCVREEVELLAQANAPPSQVDDDHVTTLCARSTKFPNASWIAALEAP
jgi:L-alanine-DL-glutamate epimerase-like enolase superfamily enzyme